MKNEKFILGFFLDENKMISALDKLRIENVEIFDIYSPFPVHEWEHYLKIKKTRLPLATFFGSLLGIVLAFVFQYWTSVIDWPLNVGGKPYNSYPAFVPITFEVSVLLASFITAILFFITCKLRPQIHSEYILKEATNNQFVVSVSLEKFQMEKVKTIFLNNGAIKIEQAGA